MMKRHALTATIIFLAATLFTLTIGTSGQAQSKKPTPSRGKVYGEWRIRIRPDKGPEYNRLIEQKGLPLFREAGGRMVGWWTTLIGDLYEHVTIWEYDNMAAFEKAAQFLSKDDRFAEFVKLRDPLLSGEESRFLRLASFAEEPSLPESANVVVHEIHRAPLGRLDAYLEFMEKEGMPLFKKHGFRATGPWLVEMGKWSEVTYLFRYESLAERDRLLAELNAQPEAQRFERKLNEFTDEITTRLLLPAPFAK